MQHFLSDILCQDECVCDGVTHLTRPVECGTLNALKKVRINARTQILYKMLLIVNHYQSEVVACECESTDPTLSMCPSYRLLCPIIPKVTSLIEPAVHHLRAVSPVVKLAFARLEESVQSNSGVQPWGLQWLP